MRSEPSAITVAPARHLITAAEFTRMSEAGVFRPEDRLELIEGGIIEMSPLGRRHAACVRRLNNLLARILGGQAVVDAQNPMALGDLSQPQPDLAVFRYRDDFYYAWWAERRSWSPSGIETVSSTMGRSTMTAWKRRQRGVGGSVAPDSAFR